MNGFADDDARSPTNRPAPDVAILPDLQSAQERNAGITSESDAIKRISGAILRSADLHDVLLTPATARVVAKEVWAEIKAMAAEQPAHDPRPVPPRTTVRNVRNGDG